jgi:Flp pilus assembly protein TadD
MHRRTRIIVLGVILLAALGVYIGALRYQFAYDDHDQIVTNAAVHSWSFIRHYFVSDVWPHSDPQETSNLYRPVFLLWMLLNYKLWGPNPIGFHLTSILAHLLATLLVYFVVRRIAKDEVVALGSTLLFALHPVHIEGVVWISGVTEPLLAIFFLASLLCYLKAREPGETARGRYWWLGLSYLLYLFAVFEKETAVALPAIIFCYEWIFGPTAAPELKGEAPKAGLVFRTVSAVKSAGPYILLTGGYMVARVLALKGLGQLQLPLPARIIALTWPSILWFYVRLLVWPVGLSEFYDTPYVSSFSFTQLVLPAIGVLTIATALYFWSRRSRVVAFFSVWMVLPILPLLNLGVLKDGEIAHDRYLYLPSIGFCVLVSLALRHVHLRSAHPSSAPLSTARIPGQPAAPVLIIVALAVFYGIATAVQSPIWTSDLVLLNRGIQIAPHNLIAGNNLGKELASRGDYPSAVMLFQRVLDRKPSYWLANFNLGYVYYRTGDFPQAERYLTTAIRINPADAAEYRFLGYTYAELGKNAEAERTLRHAIELKHDAPNQHFVLGTLLKERGDIDGALSEFKEEVAVNPDHAQARQEIAEIARTQSK